MRMVVKLNTSVVVKNKDYAQVSKPEKLEQLLQPMSRLQTGVATETTSMAVSPRQLITPSRKNRDLPTSTFPRRQTNLPLYKLDGSPLNANDESVIMVSEITNGARKHHTSKLETRENTSVSADPDYNIDIHTCSKFSSRNAHPLRTLQTSSLQYRPSCTKQHHSRTQRPVTMGLADYRRIPITNTAIVPFAVPHMPQRLLYGRVRKQLDQDPRRPHGSPRGVLTLTQKFARQRRISVPTTVRAEPFVALNEINTSSKRKYQNKHQMQQ